MKKQFEILEKVFDNIQKSNIKMKKLKEAIEQEYNKIQKELIQCYNHDAEILYLVQFNQYGFSFYKATKEKLHELSLTWFESKTYFTKPKSEQEGIKLFEEMNSPTNCEIRSYRDFGFFHDINKRWGRIDWITEEIMDKKFLYEIDKKWFNRALEMIFEFYKS